MRAGIIGTLLLAGCAGGLGQDGGSSAGLGDTSDATTGTTHADASGEPDGSGTGGTTGGSTSPDGTTTTDPSETDEPPPACAAPWRTARNDGTLADLALDSTTDTIYAVGTLPSGESWAMALDACDGSVLADTTVEHGPATSTTLSGVTLADGAVIVVGSAVLATDPRNGLYGRLDASDLTTVWTAPLFGSDDQDEVIDVTVSADGSLWMSGTSRYDTMPTAWSVRGTTAGAGACGFGWNGLGSGSARAIAADGDALVVAIRATDGTLVLARYDQTCTCMCQPTWESAPISLGGVDTSVGELLVVGGQYYVAGWASDAGSDLYAHVTWVSSMGVVIETYTTNLTPDHDGFFFVGTDDERLYLGGGEGWMGEAGFTGATGLLQALELPLAANAQPAWEARPTDVDVIHAVGIEPGADGFLYVGGNIDADGVVLRCDKQGSCG